MSFHFNHSNIWQAYIQVFLITIYDYMLPQNIINPEKAGNIQGKVFHVFYPDLNTSILFDRDLHNPIIWGSKNVVMTHLKKVNELLGVPRTVRVKIYTYILDQNGFRRVDTYDGPIETIGKYIRRI